MIQNSLDFSYSNNKATTDSKQVTFIVYLFKSDSLHHEKECCVHLWLYHSTVSQLP